MVARAPQQVERGLSEPLTEVRRRYADAVVEAAEAGYEPIREAFATVPRERFLGPGPWRIFNIGLSPSDTPDSDPRHVYANVLVVLDESLKLNNGEPRFWASLFDRLRPRPGERVVHIGAGTGYYTAIVAEMVGPAGQVIGIEYEPHLAARAKTALADRDNVELLTGDAFELLGEPADVIVASAGLDTVPLAWIRLLNDGGRLMIPLTADLPGHARISGGVTLMVTRRGDVFDACFVGPVGIYNCHSGRSGEASAKLAAALRKPELGALIGSPLKAASLRIGGAADDSCWLEGDGWWISTRSNP